MVDQPLGLRVPYVRWNMGSGRIVGNDKQISSYTECSFYRSMDI